jgi:hypothetical protein
MVKKYTKVSDKFLAQLGQGSYWAINKTLHKILGLEETLLLQHFIDLQYNIYGNEEFYQQQERIMDILCLSEKKVRSITSKLSSLGILSIVKKGVPAKNYYYVNMENVVEIMEGTSCAEMDTTGGVEMETTGSSEMDTTNKTNHLQDQPSQDHSFTRPLNIIAKEDIAKEEKFNSWKEVDEYLKQNNLVITTKGMDAKGLFNDYQPFIKGDLQKQIQIIKNNTKQLQTN